MDFMNNALWYERVALLLRMLSMCAREKERENRKEKEQQQGYNA